MTMAIEKILDKNNEGVQHLGKNKLTSARESFQMALLYLNEFHKAMLNTKDACRNRVFSLHLELYPIPNSPNKNSKATKHICWKVFTAYINQTPNELNSTKKIQGKDLTDYRVLKSMVVFNMCLLRHLEASRCELDSSFAAVIELYKVVWCAFRLERLSLRSIAWSKVFNETMNLVIVNNLGAAYHSLGDYQNATVCFRSLESILVSNTPGVQVLDQCTRNEMAMNIWFLKEPLIASAA